MTIEILNSKKTEEIKKIIEDTYGLHLGGIFLISGENRIRFFDGKIDIRSLHDFQRNFFVEAIGIYFGRLFDEGFRLSFDSASLFQKEITKNIIHVKKEEMEEWFKGGNLKTEMPNGFYIIKFNEDAIGCAKVSNKTILNYVPKEKRLKKGII